MRCRCIREYYPITDKNLNIYYSISGGTYFVYLYGCININDGFIMSINEFNEHFVDISVDRDRKIKEVLGE
jgi:hypothetical protein